MDPISIAALVISTWKLIEPYAKKVGGKLAEKAGESLPGVVDKIWDTLKEKLETRPESATLPAELAATPDDQVLQGAFQFQLKKLLENDEAFAQQLEKLVNEAKQVTTTYSATLHGDGAIAQGVGAKAVGKGGILIEGGVKGSNIISGNNNKVTNSATSTDKKKGKKK